MTKISKILVQNLRIHDAYVLHIKPGVTILSGKNGAGKTTLLEAICIAFQGTSFRGSDRELLKKSSIFWRIEAEFTDGSIRKIGFDPSKASGRKKMVLDEKVQYRMTQKNKLPVVIFEPEDLRLLSGSPVRRRHFLDKILSQIDLHYAQDLKKYERALKQRNNLLKNGFSNEEMFVWHVALSEYGAKIINKRMDFIKKINVELPEFYKKIAHNSHEILAEYSQKEYADMRHFLLKSFEENIQKDTHLGYTSIGPHRDDIHFLYNERPVSESASRGEIRSMVLALKFMEVVLIEQQINKKPIILLDDVFSELDETRQKYLTQFFKEHQVIITATESKEDSVSI